MAHAPAESTERPAEHQRTPRSAGRVYAPITPGKVAIWLFLATEIMFFTGLIGSYIVLRAGSPSTGYSNLFPPATDLSERMDSVGVRLVSGGGGKGAKDLVEYLSKLPGLDKNTAEQAGLHTPMLLGEGLRPAEADKLLADLKGFGAEAELVPLRSESWPKPYDSATNPLSIDLTAVNTFILICSSVTMVFALSAIQRGDKKKLALFLLATFLIGSTFLGIQVYEYYQLMFGHHYPPGISKTGHFRPDSSLFASCFFTMTGFHGAHVAAGVIALGCIFLKSLWGGWTKKRHASVEIVGLYWHFVDLVWIILFTVVYLI
jgi:heme/copper-type cytochrome/quinol oxidase subunit 3